MDSLFQYGVSGGHLAELPPPTGASLTHLFVVLSRCYPSTQLGAYSVSSYLGS